MDEDVISYLCKIRIDLKVDPRLPKGVGDKILIRRLAMDIRIGPLVGVCNEEKRAIQFGSKSAKMENSKEKGDDIFLKNTATE